jgi:hypothetical protein
MAWDWNNDPQNPDATPVYSVFGFGAAWTTYEWMTWHEAMVLDYGLTHANATFVQAWNGGAWYEKPPASDAIADNTFNAYMRQAGVWDSIAPSGIFGKMGDTVGEVAGDAASALTTSSTLLKWIAPVAIIGAIVVIALPYAMPAVKKAAKSVK